MTRRASALDYIEPEPVASVHPLDLDDLASRRRRADDRLPPRQHLALRTRRRWDPRGAVFVPFCYYEAAANMLTNPALDPFARFPNSSTMRVKVTGGGSVPERMSFGAAAYLLMRWPHSAVEPRM